MFDVAKCNVVGSLSINTVVILGNTSLHNIVYELVLYTNYMRTEALICS